MESCFLSVLGRPNTKLPWSIKHRKGNVMANTLLTMLRQLAFQHWLIILATSHLRFGQTFFHLRVFLNEVLPFSKYLEMSLGFLICESSHLTPHTLQLKISPSYESDRETMENATLRQLFSHGLSLPNGLLFNNLNSILNFSKDHSHNFFARPSKDLLACSKHSLEA